ncbi:MAG: CRISPR-associated endonuclease Cas6 [Vampirovibrionia bacterium]
MTFAGDVKLNMVIPSYIGLGKAVSRGFGTIIKN